MPEINTEQNDVPEVKEEEKNIPQIQNTVSPRSLESLWGAFLFSFMILFVLASITSIAWGMYSGWKNDREAKSEPSIAILSQKSSTEEKTVSSETPAEETNQSEEQKSEDASLTAKKLTISVLNGGAMKGSAGTITTFFKTEGYVNVTPGNALKDYTGAVVYYAPALEKEAEVIRMTLAKKYPQAKILPVDVKNKETSVSQITVILGK